MAQEHKSQSTGALRGFASMDEEKQREIARKGGQTSQTRRTGAHADSNNHPGGASNR